MIIFYYGAMPSLRRIDYILVSYEQALVLGDMRYNLPAI